MKAFEIIVIMLSSLPRQSFGRQHLQCQTSLLLVLSSPRVTSPRLSPPSSSLLTVPSVFQAQKFTDRTNSWLQANNPHHRLRPTPKVTRRRATMTASAASSMGYDCGNDEGEGATVDIRPKAGLLPRSAYQFYPVKPGSARPMPPSVSDYYSTDKYNTDESLDSPGEDMENYDYPSDVYDTMRDAVAVEESSAKKTFRIIQPQELQKPSMMNDTTEMISSSDTAQDLKASSEQTNTPETISNADSFSYKRIVPRVNPSFMEPVKFKALGGGLSSHNHVLISESSQRDIPIKASDGNSSTSHLAALSRQLEHLTLQIYQLNGGVEFNINSPKQVANVLFGDGEYDTSTNKDVLEAMASAGNEMA